VKYFVLKFSGYMAAGAFFWCLLSQVSFKESLFRSAMVFVGSYAILVGFLVCLRFILSPKETKENG